MPMYCTPFEALRIGKIIKQILKYPYALGE
jgi:hypothetical protein